ncbi:MAG TPA: DUF1499 domain-containing protein [Geminicoccaceae bacterium]|nr:DUF1499 domain-containing protein [Geminicoccaceae bacterium]
MTPIATIGFALAVLAALACGSAGIGYRLGWWSLGTGFGLIRVAVYGAIAAMVISALGLVLARPGGGRRGLYRALAGLAIGAVVFGVPWSYLRTAQRVPPIHDITTDTENPPAFVAILPLRAGAANPADYGGAEVAAQQHDAYPAIQPVQTSLPPDQAFAAAVATAEDQDWQIVAADPAEGRIEAIDTTFWWGFKDDVVIRIRPQDSGSRLDLRSTSRIGLGDFGTNAARVEAFLEDFQGRVAQGG